MSLMEPIVLAAEDRWTQAARAADRFRGAFIHHHARGETLISEALLTIHDARKGAPTPLPHLAGQRLVELRRAVEARRAECAHMAHVMTVLDGFQRFERARGFICHGLATLLLDQQDQWALGYKLLCFKANAPHRETWFLPQADAAALLADLNAAVDRLPPALGHVRKLAAKD